MKPQVVCIDDIERYALDNLNKSVADYYRSGANDEQTLAENRRAFARLRIRPRFLRDVSQRSLRTTVLGQPIAAPVCASPSAMQKMAHPMGELATAKACETMDTIMILSTISTSSIEEVAAEASVAMKWFQLYIYRDREVTRQLVERAERSGFGALVLTVDTPMFGHRLADSRNGFCLPPHLRMANFVAGAQASDAIQNRPTDGQSGLSEYAQSLFDPSIEWKDLRWLRSITRLPIVVKGVLTREDALLALKYGCSAILVSNHGARQLDGVPATIEALPEVVKAVQNRCEVYLDGGVRTGTDVLKALALGARAVFIGRPILWGLAYDGQSGVEKVFSILKQELDMAMALSGLSTVTDIANQSTTSSSSPLVVSENYYRSQL
ncbi:2-Hydroxyacid oxidase 1-like [Oppia nitens]|uniref:2-Hydroxyacid oxidase 1-like n=1 Tax=Oppia nitens TaxID=1686743 RepID=UPI0023DAEFA0|nr:2-Hydroxyacid oxidase 1-like [Oppia nitens]